MNVPSADYLRHNCFAGTAPQTYGGTNGNINANPLFMPGGDYRLMPGSPCIDAGDTSYAVGSTDLAGLPRIVGLAVDMGAHEAQPPPISLTDAARALRIAGGMTAASASDPARLNIVDPSTSGIGLPDAIALARKASGL